mmetsp:Transcript_55571/g.121724  ORF Transcript_55571/g.121724 Transcript_55571/m.121724 type:complete len:258 (-) Transcript_55571:463-1236(-)
MVVERFWNGRKVPDHGFGCRLRSARSPPNTKIIPERLDKLAKLEVSGRRLLGANQKNARRGHPTPFQVFSDLRNCGRRRHSKILFVVSNVLVHLISNHVKRHLELLQHQNQFQVVLSPSIARHQYHPIKIPQPHVSDIGLKGPFHSPSTRQVPNADHVCGQRLYAAHETVRSWPHCCLDDPHRRGVLVSRADTTERIDERRFANSDPANHSPVQDFKIQVLRTRKILRGLRASNRRVDWGFLHGLRQHLGQEPQESN